MKIELTKEQIEEIIPELSVEQLAEYFVDGFADNQAALMNLIGEKFKSAEWNIDVQFHSIVQDLDENGIDFIVELNEFIKESKNV